VNRKTLTVTGMSCTGCEQNVENALQNLEGVTQIDADNESDSVEVVADDDVDEEVHSAIEQAGDEVVG